jgi:hypothetical protein
VQPGHDARPVRPYRSAPAGSGADVAAARGAETAAEKLGKQLRSLEGLALKVVAVQPLSPVARGTAPLPPLPHPLAGGAARSGGGVARCLEPVEVLVTLESSGGGAWGAERARGARKRVAGVHPRAPHRPRAFAGPRGDDYKSRRRRCAQLTRAPHWCFW